VKTFWLALFYFIIPTPIIIAYVFVYLFMHASCLRLFEGWWMIYSHFRRKGYRFSVFILHNIILRRLLETQECRINDRLACAVQYNISRGHRATTLSLYTYIYILYYIVISGDGHVSTYMSRHVGMIYIRVWVSGCVSFTYVQCVFVFVYRPRADSSRIVRFLYNNNNMYVVVMPL